jgi:hypothetical protein
LSLVVAVEVLGEVNTYMAVAVELVVLGQIQIFLPHLLQLIP